MYVVLTLAASLLAGASDFLGGSLSRRMSPRLVVFLSQAVGLVLMLAIVALVGARPDSWTPMVWAFAAGCTTALGLLALYRALAIGTMSIVSPIATLGVIVPVFVGIGAGRWPGVLLGIGMLVAVVGVVMSAGPKRASRNESYSIRLAFYAALSFGAGFVFLNGAVRHSPLVSVVALRCGTIILLMAIAGVVAVRRRRAGPSVPVEVFRTARFSEIFSPSTIFFTIIVGVFDVSGALLLVFALANGPLAIVSVLGSLYPAVVVLLAALIYRERVAVIQRIGIGFVLLGSLLIGGWG